MPRKGSKGDMDIKDLEWDTVLYSTVPSTSYADNDTMNGLLLGHIEYFMLHLSHVCNLIQQVSSRHTEEMTAIIQTPPGTDTIHPETSRK